MEDNFVMFWPFSIPIVAIVGSFIYAIVATISKNRVRELEVRERIAMIERGMVPPPEVDPRGFDRAMNRIDRLNQHDYRRGYGRHRRAGITIIGVGFGLMVMIAFAGGEPERAIGVGGFLVILGIAFFINSLFDRHSGEPPAPMPVQFGAPGPTPPGPIDSQRRD